MHPSPPFSVGPNLQKALQKKTSAPVVLSLAQDWLPLASFAVLRTFSHMKKGLHAPAPRHIRIRRPRLCNDNGSASCPQECGPCTWWYIHVRPCSTTAVLHSFFPVRIQNGCFFCPIVVAKGGGTVVLLFGVGRGQRRTCVTLAKAFHLIFQRFRVMGKHILDAVCLFLKHILDTFKKFGAGDCHAFAIWMKGWLAR